YSQLPTDSPLPMVAARRDSVRNVSWKASSARCWSFSTRRHRLRTSPPCRHISSSNAASSRRVENRRSSSASGTPFCPPPTKRRRTAFRSVCPGALAMVALGATSVPHLEAGRGQLLPTTCNFFRAAPEHASRHTFHLAAPVSRRHPLSWAAGSRTPPEPAAASAHPPPSPTAR